MTTNNTSLILEHRWMVISCMLYDLMGKEAIDLERQGRKDYEIVAMLIQKIDKALTEDFEQAPLTETDIIKLIQGIDIITTIAERKEVTTRSVTQ